MSPLHHDSHPLWGLILMGGKSSRMGRDKSLLHYHGIFQFRYCETILKPFCERILFSCRKEQPVSNLISPSQVLFDAAHTGPASGLIEAFSISPPVSWMVLGIDYPNLTQTDLRFLVENHRGLATAFRNQEDSLPEPLVSIWSPKAQEHFKKNVFLGKLSPRKALCELSCHLIDPPYPQSLENVNQSVNHSSRGPSTNSLKIDLSS